MLIGSALPTVVFWEAAKKPILYARKIEALARNAPSMMTVTLGAASLEHARRILHATMKN